MTERALEVLQGVFIDDTRVGNDLAIRLMDALSSANLHIVHNVTPASSDDALVLRRVIQQLSFNRAAGYSPDETTIRALGLLVADLERRSPAVCSNPRNTQESDSEV